MTEELSRKIAAMRDGGKILARVREQVAGAVRSGIHFEELEALARSLIEKLGAQPSFTTVDDYHWATCITKNEGCCHGIPVGGIVNSGDLITVDVGVLYKGYHTDTTTTVYVGSAPPKKIQDFLETGKRALEAGIRQARPGNSVYDISIAMQREIEEAGYGSVYQLTGHGIGKQLHERPNIPCFADPHNKDDVLVPGQTIAIEPMYAMGNPRLKLGKDGWTYETVDGSLTSMFEHTVAITDGDPEVLTR